MDHLRTRPLLRLAVALLAAGCAAPSAPPAAAPPADLARLESAVARTPRDPGALVSLAAAYEERERWDDARAAYRRALDARPPAGAAMRVRDRLLLVERRSLAAEARSALARERELSAAAPEPRTVAVFPFAHAGGPPELRPLGRALAEMLVTDLSQTERLRVLERARVQALLDEMRLGASGRVAPETAARSGRLLRAEHVVAGTLVGDSAALSLASAVTRVDGGGRVVAPAAERGTLPALLDMEKRLALGLYRSLGVELTPAERERVERRPTSNVRALLAFGLGLEAGDAGDFARAARHFREAAALDPGFAAAREAAGRSARLESAARVPASAVARLAAGPDFAGLDALVSGAADAGARDPAAEALGSGGSGRTTIEIRLRRP